MTGSGSPRSHRPRGGACSDNAQTRCLSSLRSRRRHSHSRCCRSRTNHRPRCARDGSVPSVATGEQLGPAVSIEVARERAPAFVCDRAAFRSLTPLHAFVVSPTAPVTSVKPPAPSPANSRSCCGTPTEFWGIQRSRFPSRSVSTNVAPAGTQPDSTRSALDTSPRAKVPSP